MTPEDISALQTQFTTHVPPIMRFFLFIFGLFPLYGIYDLLIKPDWSHAHGLIWLFFLIIGLGCATVSFFFFMAGFMGLSQRVTFDAQSQSVEFLRSNLLYRNRLSRYPFTDISLEVVTHDWSDGPSTHSIRVTPITDKPFSFGDFTDTAAAEDCMARLNALRRK